MINLNVILSKIMLVKLIKTQKKMTNKEAYETVLEELVAIPTEDVMRPTMPVDIYIQEAENLSYHANKDREAMLAKGLKVMYVDTFLTRVGALQYTQSEWLTVSKNKSEAARQWSELSEKASALHRELLHDFRFAYRNDKELKTLVDKIAEGSGNADMIQDLSDMHAVGKANSAPLVAINMDMTKLDLAGEYASSMGTVLATVNGVRDDNDKPAKEIRDRAFTFLKEAVDEICEYGKYLFWKDEEKLEKYSSAYFRNLRKQKVVEGKASE